MSTHRQRFRWAFICAGAFAVLALIVRTGRSEGFDDWGLQFMEAIRGPGLTQFFVAITTIGGGVSLFPLALLVALVLYIRGHRQDALLYLVSTMIGWAIYAGLKASFARPRPTLIPRLSVAGWWSFPSGHSMLSTIVLGSAVILLTKSPVLRAVGGVMILLIMASRVYLGVHYPSDVIGGMFAGCAAVAVMLGLREKRMAPPPAG